MRRATHAGSWYHKDEEALARELSSWLKASDATSETSCPAQVDGPGRVLGIIAPHAGYSFSGSTAAYAYRHLKPGNVKRVFILGPSHHLYVKNAMLTSASTFETPLGNLNVDLETIAELNQKARKGLFDAMPLRNDEEEHSIEMHLPYIAHVTKSSPVKVVPVVIGDASPTIEQELGELFAPYLADPENFFVISSDFCHWGARFHYQYADAAFGSLWQSIEALDRRGMGLIEAGNPDDFRAYLRQTKNTICGRHPIAVMLHALKATGNADARVEFVQYAQSSKVSSMTDSSVSYASAVVYG
eukprot:CAMPEP_0184549704 /NCGR_PEP_ID=MMETSP0199_2-20130426/11934_1 /TAXON_ID=1112570 /ORGANISM="Thraustochytrium sp., Strain LLF1b" /LENGTH=300 /DNA_ID=CAMNT_0026944447 /DNA_START=17 /DNA_END=919 /DNA_ORIENTATION=+